MTQNNLEDNVAYHVVINQEGQYSIWPTHRKVPSGWKKDDKTGTKKDCLDYIAQVWTDMRPLSLRNMTDSSSST
ncbi:MbtH family NRPS accessory protein [Leptothoe sp. EHU-05/26/07-4]